MDTTVVGLGYVGLVTACCLARNGHRVHGVEVDPAKVELLRRGRSPLVETGLDEVLASVVAAGSLTVTTSTTEAVCRTAVTLVCVGTPTAQDGSVDVRALRRVAEEIGAALRIRPEPHLVVLRSTLLPNLVRDVFLDDLRLHSGGRIDSHHGFAVNPEFLREGSAIRDFDRPPAVVIGTDRPERAGPLHALYEGVPAPIHLMTIESACMLKYASNAFHALKISFTNEISRLCRAAGANPFEVMDVFVTDHDLNVSPAYLKPGFAFGGSCLGKDLRGLAGLARRSGAPVPLLESITRANEILIEDAHRRILDPLPRTVALLGLAFKPGTDDLRESPFLRLAAMLRERGVRVVCHDPRVRPADLIGANRAWAEAVFPGIDAHCVGSPEEAVRDAEVVLLCHPGILDPDLVRKNAPAARIIDLCGVLRNRKRAAGVEGLNW